MKFRRFSAFFLALLLAVLCVLPASAVAEGCTQETNVTTILFTHDLHSHFLPQPTAEGGESGGYARLKTAIDGERAMNPAALLVDGGDFSIGSLIQTLYTTQAAELRTMGALGYDAVTIGNHEFDHKGIGFGVNLMLMNPCADEMAQIIMEEGVQVVTTGAGSPGKYIPAWKEAGIKVLPVVAASILAKRLVNQGADAIIAEGMESGGHVGEMTTMALVPQVIDTVDVPVIAAGGIADGRQAAAAFALGACGIQVGTCLLTSRECPIHENYKLALLKAKDSDTTVTGRSIGGPVRVLKNKMAREYLALEKRGATLEELEHVTLGGLRRAVFEGDMERGSVMAGQVAGMLHEIKPLRQIFEELYNSSRAVLKATEAAWQ